jgi:hypothetical protein
MLTRKPRLALILERERSLTRWLEPYETVALRRDRFLSAELAAAAPDLLLLESVHPSEAGWLLSWLRAQPRLAGIPVLMLLPFGPAPARTRGCGFLVAPVEREPLIDEIDRLLGSPTPPPAARRR